MTVANDVGLRFTVAPEHEAEVSDLYAKAGFTPLRIEHKEDGNIVFVLPKVPDDKMYSLITAVPSHYSVIQAFVARRK